MRRPISRAGTVAGLVLLGVMLGESRVILDTRDAQTARPAPAVEWLYTTAGTARTVVALNPATGEVLWKHAEDEGPRGQNAARSGGSEGAELIAYALP